MQNSNFSKKLIFFESISIIQYKSKKMVKMKEKKLKLRKYKADGIVC